MPITLSDKIENAPKGSRLRNLFDDSSDDGSFGLLSAVDNSQKSQATWVGTQAPPTIQTQPEPYTIPRKPGFSEQKNVDERCPTPKPKTRQIEISDTPGTGPKASPPQTCTTSNKDTTQDERLGSYLCGDLEPFKLQLESDKPVQSRRSEPARVSLSPSNGKSRTNVSTISSLEALHPPPVPVSRACKVNKKEQSITKQESIVVDEEFTKFDQRLSTNSINSKSGKSDIPGKTAMNVKTSSPRDAIAKEPPKKKTKKQLKNSSEEKQPDSDDHKPTSIEARKSCKKRKQIRTATGEDDDSRFGTENSPATLPEKSTIEKEIIASDKVNRKPPTERLISEAVAEAIQSNAGPSAPEPVPLQPKKKRTFQDQVLAKMLFSCKAYNLKTLANSVNTTEVALQYLMLSLLDKKIVIKKEFTSKAGKTKDLYWANQESRAKEVMKLMPGQQEMEEAQRELSHLRRLDTEIAREMTILHQELSNDEIHAQLREMELKVNEVKDKVTSIRTSIKKSKECKQLPVTVRSCAKKTSAKLGRENCPRRTALRINAMREEWKSRKQKCMDFVEHLADGMEKKPKDVIKLLEIETDEMESVVMPPKRVIENASI